MPIALRLSSFPRALRIATAVLLGAGSARAQDRVLRVLGTDSLPIPYAFVQANGGHALLSDEDGRVSIGSGKKQTFTIEVRRIGYSPFYGKIDFPDTAITIPLILQSVGQQLSTVKVNVNKTKSSLELSGFYRRWLDGQKGVNTAVFIGPEEIEKRNATRTSNLLNGVSGISITRTATGNNVVVTGGGTCPMAIVLDGRQVCANGGCLRNATKAGVDDLTAVLIDQIVDMGSVAGIEVYKRGGNMPSDFHVDGDCGAVAIWTGTRRR
jgi:hypothetical protein